MSLSALVWAFEQKIRPATCKFVLVALADNINCDNEAWPSIENLCQKTSLDRKTVIASLDALEAAGFLIDTKKRVGRTGLIKVYKFNGVPEEKSFNYVYQLTHKETGQFYIGVRSCLTNPELDPYLGSGSWPNKINAAFLEKKIIKTFDTREEAEAYEIYLIRENSFDVLCMNKQHRITNSSKNGTVPIFPSNSAVFPNKQSQKRNTEPVIEPVIEPVNNNPPISPLTDDQGEPNDKSAKRASRFPKNWQPNQQHRQRCQELGVDCRELEQEFRDWHISKGSKFHDWDAAFRTWIRNAKKFSKHPTATTTHRRASYHDNILDVARGLADSYEKSN